MVTESVVHQKRDSPFFVSTVPVQMKETRSSVGAALAHRDARPLLWLGDPRERERERERGREGGREGNIPLLGFPEAPVLLSVELPPSASAPPRRGSY